MSFSRRQGDRFNRGRIATVAGSGGGADLPLSFWANGGFWDFSTLSGAQNDSLTVAMPSLIGSNSLTPSVTVPPKLHINGVGGLNAGRTVEDTATGANFQYWTCDAVAPILRSNSWTVYWYGRRHTSKEQPFWSCLRSDGGATEQLFGRMVSETLVLRKRSTVGGVTNHTAVRCPDPYSFLQAAWVLDAGTVSIYSQIEGETTVIQASLGAIDVNALSAAVNRFTFHASRSSVPFEAFSGYLGKCGVSDAPLSAAQAAALFAQTRAAEYVRPRATARHFIVPGDSITLCVQDSFFSAGWREILATFCYDNAISWESYASGQGGGGTGAGGAGIFRLGLTGNTWTSANSGQTIAQIQTQALADIAAAPTPVRFYPCMMGCGDNNALTAPATIAASYLSAATAILTAGIARDLEFRLAVTTIPPLNRATLASTDDNAQAFNALLKAPAGIWDQLDALFPSNKLFRWDCYAALDNTWSAADFGADNSHPQRSTGHAKMSCRSDYGQLWATDGTQNLATWLRAQSPSVAKPCALVGALTAPTGGASLPNATPVSVTATCTRVACKAEFKLDGAVVAVMTPVDTYTHFAAGVQHHTPVMRYSYTWTPGALAIGARTLTVTFTDPDETTIVTSAGVSVTVT